MLLSHNELMELVYRGVILGAKPEHVNAASIDITLGPKIMVEMVPMSREDYLDSGEEPPEGAGMPVDICKKESISMFEKEMGEDGYILKPGEFILAHSQEVFYLPDNISAEYKLKSTMARNGLGHLLAGWCDAGWHGSVLTMEFHNVTQYQNLRIRPGMKCGQMIFFHHNTVPEEASYATKGQYNHDTQVTRGKHLR